MFEIGFHKLMDSFQSEPFHWQILPDQTRKSTNGAGENYLNICRDPYYKQTAPSDRFPQAQRGKQRQEEHRTSQSFVHVLTLV